MGRPGRARRSRTSYHVRIRYQILAFRTERISQYREMTAAFAKAGFVRDADDEPDPDEAENQNATRMRGVVPAKGLDRLVRQRHVRSVLAYPKGAKLPEKGGPRARRDAARLGLRPRGAAQAPRPDEQGVVRGIGFVEAFGYDHRGDTRLVGSVPADALDQLLGDPRKLKGADERAGPVPRPSAASR